MLSDDHGPQKLVSSVETANRRPDIFSSLIPARTLQTLGMSRRYIPGTVAYDKNYFDRSSIPLYIAVFLVIASSLWALGVTIEKIAILFNKFHVGNFKRPLPNKPELYYDINCIDRMNLSDFIQEDQVQRCAKMNYINRPGPVKF